MDDHKSMNDVCKRQAEFRTLCFLQTFVWLMETKCYRLPYCKVFISIVR